MATFWLVFYITLIGSVLVCIASIVVRYLREIRAARERINRLNSQMIETRQGPIEYLRVGDGYPILVVHGALGGFDQGLWLAKGLGLNILDLQIISVSRFGYLRSLVPEGANLDMQADAFALLLDTLQIRQVAVFAASGGSTSAIRFVARHPDLVSVLILLCPDAPPGMFLPPRFLFDTFLRSNFLYWLILTFFPKSVQNATSMVPKGYVLTPEHKTMINSILRGNFPISTRIDGFIFETYTTANEFQDSISETGPYPLSKIELPVLVIDALDDPITNIENVRGLAKRMPNARLFIVQDGGHFFFGHTEEVKEKINQFLHSNVTELRTASSIILREINHENFKNYI